MRDLKEELGVQLFARTSRRVDLTEAGALFKVEAERTVAQAGRAQEVAAKAARCQVGTLRIGFTGNASITGTLSDDLGHFRHRFPEVGLDIREIAPMD